MPLYVRHPLSERPRPRRLARRTVRRDDQRVRRLLVTAPPGVIVAVWVLVTIALWILLPGPHGVMGFLAVVVGGGFAWCAGRREQQKADYVTGPLTRPERVAVYRAAVTGVAPADPALHRAALDLARFRLAGAVRDRFPCRAVFAILIAGSLGLAMTDGWLEYAVYAAFFGLALVWMSADVPRQRRRVARLEQAIGESAYPASPA